MHQLQRLPDLIANADLRTPHNEGQHDVARRPERRKTQNLKHARADAAETLQTRQTRAVSDLRSGTGKAMERERDFIQRHLPLSTGGRGAGAAAGQPHACRTALFDGQAGGEMVGEETRQTSTDLVRGECDGRLSFQIDMLRSVGRQRVFERIIRATIGLLAEPCANPEGGYDPDHGGSGPDDPEDRLRRLNGDAGGHVLLLSGSLGKTRGALQCACLAGKKKGPARSGETSSAFLPRASGALPLTWRSIAAVRRGGSSACLRAYRSERAPLCRRTRR